MKIVINGAAGRMGQTLCSIANNEPGVETVALVDRSLKTDVALKMYSCLSDFTGEADVIIDFSNHAATSELIEYALARKMPVVIATTGQSEDENETIRICSGSVPVFLSYNMSMGIAYLVEAAKRAAAMFPNSEIEIVETHHDKKLDVPSGTAIMLADSIIEAKKDAFPLVGRRGKGPRDKNEIGIHSLRLGNVVGIHEVIISTGTQTITLKHEAHDRSLFAEGAIFAAEFIKDKAPGLYSMRDIAKGE